MPCFRSPATDLLCPALELDGPREVIRRMLPTTASQRRVKARPFSTASCIKKGYVTKLPVSLPLPADWLSDLHEVASRRRVLSLYQKNGAYALRWAKDMNNHVRGELELTQDTKFRLLIRNTVRTSRSRGAIRNT